MPATSFPETRWTLVVMARDLQSAAGKAALSELCELYWRPLYFYIRRRGYSPEEAEDLTQDYFYHVLEKENFALADVRQGRLRAFLLTGLKNFLSDDWDRRRAQKRGGKMRFFSIDQFAAEERYAIEPMDIESPDVVYEKQWARTILETIMHRLKDEHQKAGTMNYFEALQGFLGWNASESNYQQPAVALGISVNAARLRVMRMRRRYGELLRACIADTVTSEDELLSEMDYLFRIVRA